MDKPVIEKPTRKAKPAVALDDFIAQHEDAAQRIGAVVTRIVFPGATDRVHAGRYAGIVIIKGELSATYSDGSKH